MPIRRPRRPAARRPVRRALRLAAAVSLAACDRGATAPAPPDPMLAVRAAGVGSGRIVSTPAGIDCLVSGGAASGACSAPFARGAAVTLAAMPDSVSRFGGWAGPCAGAAECALVVQGASAVEATFDGPRFRLTAGTGGPSSYGSGAGDGSVEFQPGGVTCRITGGVLATPCEVSTRPGEALTMTLVPDSGQVGLVQWSGQSPLPLGCNPFAAGTGAARPRFVCTGVLARADGELRVNLFRHLLAVARATLANGTGRVVDRTLGIDCALAGTAPSGMTGVCGVELAPGTPVSLVATPQAGTLFRGWGGACPASTGPTCAFEMRAGRQTATVDLRAFP